MKKGWHICVECGRKRERYLPVSRLPNGWINWVCRPCWKALDYDQYMYEHRSNT